MTDSPPEPVDDVSTRHGPGTIFAWTIWLGLASGCVELAAMVLKCSYWSPRNYNLSHHYPWMFPAAGVLVLLGPGCLLALAAIVSRRSLPASITIGVLSFVAYLGVAFRLPIMTVAGLLLAAGMAVQTARIVRARPANARRLVRWTLGPMVVLAVATVAASYGRPAWNQRGSPDAALRGSSKNVLLLVLDTVRAQSLSLYGYARDTSPNLRRYSARGVRFESALATAPWTAPSHASMFTGRWPHELSIGWSRALDATYPTLAGFLASRGYRTAGFVANTTYCSYETGLNRGFAHYEDYDVTPRAILLCSAIVQRTLTAAVNRGFIKAADTKKLGSSRKDAARINRDFLDWLPPREEGPFFAFLNYYDAHHPYLSPDDCERFPEEHRPRSDADHRLLRNWWDRDKRGLTAADVALVRDSYDRCLAYLDGQVGRLLDELSRRGILDETIVVITADHGEHLGEQQLYGHGCSLYRPELHVPLVVLAPGSAAGGRVITEPVSLRDLPATVVDLVGLSAASPFPGRSLARAWSSQASGETPPPLLSEIDLPPEADPNGGRSPICRGAMVSLVSGGWHYIRNGDGREELYDFAHDPNEERDLAGSAAGEVVVRALREGMAPAGEPAIRPGDPRSAPAALARGRPSRDARPR